MKVMSWPQTSLERRVLELNMSNLEAAGAISRKLKEWTDWFDGSYTTINPPLEKNTSSVLETSFTPSANPHPPIPEDSGLTAPTHSMAVMAASTAVPLRSSTFPAISEHTATSVATAAAWMDNRSSSRNTHSNSDCFEHACKLAKTYLGKRVVESQWRSRWRSKQQPERWLKVQLRN